MFHTAERSAVKQKLLARGSRLPPRLAVSFPGLDNIELSRTTVNAKFQAYGLLDGTELSSMLATFCSYEERFGARHPVTLRLLTELGIALWRHRRTEEALIVFQRGLLDTPRTLGENGDLCMRLLSALRDLFADLGDYKRAAATQKELLECHTELFGVGHAETLAAREALEQLLLWNESSGVS
jgi:hypothetical protein